jgi:Flp pilus assembly protein TadG
MGIVRFAGLESQARGFKRLSPLIKPIPGIGFRANPICPRLCFSDRGHAVLEFAFVLPMMMAVVTGLFSFGIALNNQIELTEAVGNGGQYLQQIQSITTDPCKDVSATVANNATNLMAANLTITLTMEDNNGNSTVQSGPASNFTCAGAQSNLVTGGTATVKGTYPCSLFVYGLSFKNACELTAEVSEYEY